METSLGRSWSSLVWRGVVGVIFGVLVIALPGVTLLAIAFLFGAYAFCDGALAIAVAIRRREETHRWLLLLDGILGIAAGILTAIWPGITLLFLILLAGFRAILLGATEIAAAVRLALPKRIGLLYGLGGGISVLIGILMVALPAMGAAVLVAFLAVNAILFGALMIALGLELRSERTGRFPGGTAAVAR